MTNRDEAIPYIRQLLLTGQIKAGKDEVTSERQIVRDFLQNEFSRTPVREALAVLAERGLVVQYPNVGVGARIVTREEALETIRIRVAIEVTIVSDAATKLTDEGIEQLKGNQESITHAAHNEDTKGFFAAYTAFHTGLATLAGYVATAGTIESLCDRLQLHHMYTGGLRDDQRRDFAKQNDAILDSLGERMRQDAVDHLVQHFNSWYSSLSEQASNARDVADASANSAIMAR